MLEPHSLQCRRIERTIHLGCFLRGFSQTLQSAVKFGARETAVKCVVIIALSLASVSSGVMDGVQLREERKEGREKKEMEIL